MTQPELFRNNRLQPISLPSSRPALAAAALAMGIGAGGAGAGPSYQLSFTMEKQSELYWCWAAVTVSVSTFYSHVAAWTQCSLASAVLGIANCCAASTPCNQVYYLDLALSRTNNLNTAVTNPVAASDLQSELGAGRPVGCRIGWSNQTGHFVAITGYQNDGVTEQVTVDDPFYEHSQMTIDHFTNSYQNDGSWTDTYYTKA